MGEYRGKGLGPEPHGVIVAKLCHTEGPQCHLGALEAEKPPSTLSPAMPSHPDPLLFSHQDPEKRGDLSRSQR